MKEAASSNLATTLGAGYFPPDKIVGGRWKIVKQIGQGSNGMVFMVDDLRSPPPFSSAALKLEVAANRIKLEAYILEKVGGHRNIPQLLASGKNESFRFMVMKLLGNPISHNQRLLGKLPVASVCRVGIDVLLAIKSLHSAGFLHRDIKALNMCIGYWGTPEEKHVFLVDYGAAREFTGKNSKGETGMKVARTEPVIRGTMRYNSIRVHDRIEAGRGDDLFMLLYTLAELAAGSLPWAREMTEEQITECKRTTSDELLLAAFPKRMQAIPALLRTYDYYSVPDYSAIYNILTRVYDKCPANERTVEWPWEWEMSRDGAWQAERWNRKEERAKRQADLLFLQENPLGI